MKRNIYTESKLRKPSDMSRSEIETRLRHLAHSHPTQETGRARASEIYRLRREWGNRFLKTLNVGRENL